MAALQPKPTLLSTLINQIFPESILSWVRCVRKDKQEQIRSGVGFPLHLISKCTPPTTGHHWETLRKVLKALKNTPSLFRFVCSNTTNESEKRRTLTRNSELPGSPDCSDSQLRFFLSSLQVKLPWEVPAHYIKRKVRQTPQEIATSWLGFISSNWSWGIIMDIGYIIWMRYVAIRCVAFFLQIHNTPLIQQNLCAGLIKYDI